jgi:2-desacetyl-2-hydroxyethyl bacteriochlorophyllide A dehydrogenase
LRSAVLASVEKIDVVEREMPTPSQDEVLVRVRAAGIGGTDLRIYKGAIAAKFPLVLGQEFGGTVEKVGPRVAGFSEGQRVAVEPVVRDGTCAYCKAGNYCLCDNLKVFGIQLDGGYSEFVSVPAYTLHTLPEGASFAEAALFVPAAVAYYAVSRAGPPPNARFAVIGAGPIGLSAVQMARLNGASEILVADPLEARSKMAKSLGASEAVEHEPAKFVESVNKRTNNQGLDVVIEATGNPDSVDMALAAAKRGGTVVFAGAFGKPATINMPNIVRKDLTVKGAWLYPNMYSKVVELVKQSKLKLNEYVSHRFPLSDAAKAFSVAQEPSATKVVLEP